MDVARLVDEIQRNHLAMPPAQDLGRWAAELPPDLREFYALTNGAYLHRVDRHGGSCEREGAWWKWKVEPVENLRTVADDGFVSTRVEGYELTRRWLKLVDVQDGDCLAISIAPETRGLVLDCFHETVGEVGSHNIVALSFTEALELLLGTTEAFWLDPARKNHGSL